MLFSVQTLGKKYFRRTSYFEVKTTTMKLNQLRLPSHNGITRHRNLGRDFDIHYSAQDLVLIYSFHPRNFGAGYA